MQMAREIVTECSESCRKDFQITCYGDHLSLRFCSGSKKNRFVVQCSNGKIYVTTVKLSWWESLKRFFKRNGGKIAGAALVGAGILMTTLGVDVPVLAIAGPILVQCGIKLIGPDDKMMITP